MQLPAPLLTSASAALEIEVKCEELAGQPGDGHSKDPIQGYCLRAAVLRIAYDRGRDRDGRLVRISFSQPRRSGGSRLWAAGLVAVKGKGSEGHGQLGGED